MRFPLFRRKPPAPVKSMRLRHRDGAELTISDVEIEAQPRVSGAAAVVMRISNSGQRETPPGCVHLRWCERKARGRSPFSVEQSAFVLAATSPGDSHHHTGRLPVPINSVVDVDIELSIVADDGVVWQVVGDAIRIERHIGGQDASAAPPDFDYEAVYRQTDLDKDYWTVVGPQSRAEYEALGRGKCAQLVSLGLNGRSRVLDIGCGTGQLTEPLVTVLGADGLYWGTDLAAEAVEFCKKRFPQSNFHFAKNEQTRLPIDGVAFDFIYLGSVFTHMYPADIAAMLGEIRRLTAAGGKVVADAFVSPEIPDYIGSRAMIQLNEKHLLNQFRDNGFSHRELASITWNEHCRRVVYVLSRSTEDA